MKLKIFDVKCICLCIVFLQVVMLSGCKNGDSSYNRDSAEVVQQADEVADESVASDAVMYSCVSESVQIGDRQIQAGQDVVCTAEQQTLASALEGDATITDVNVHVAGGQEVASSQGYCRRFVCLSEQNHFMVQDFYISGEKRTQVYAITSEQALMDDGFGLEPHSAIEGAYVQWYENGQKAQEAFFEQGAMQGAWTRWTENGVQVQETHMVDGIPHGVSRMWYADHEQLMQQGTYDQGLLEDVLVQWYESGSQMSHTRYAHGLKDGAQQIWWENGQMRSQGSFYADKEHGVWQSWWPNGALRAQGSYVTGKREGVWVWWDDEGVKRAQGHYHLGNKVGSWQYWDAQGQPQRRDRLALISPNEAQRARALQSRYGIRLASQQSAQFEVGQSWYLDVPSDLGVLSELQAQSDKFIRRYLGQTTQGYWVVQDFYADGERMSTQPFVIMAQQDLNRQFVSMSDVLQSSIDGVYTAWHVNGIHALEARMRNGEPAGRWKVWDDTGRLVNEHHYGR